MTTCAEHLDAHHLDDAHYDDVVTFLGVNAAWCGEPAAAPEPAASALVLREARVLDGRHYEHWLDLYTPDCIYWIPLAEVVGDPRTEPSLHFDDHRRLEDRVALLRTGHVHAQTPPSRTCRVVAGLEQRPGMPHGVADVHSTLSIHEHRRGRDQRFVGRQFHRLVRQHDGGWRIRYRVLLLVDRDGPLGNTTFIL